MKILSNGVGTLVYGFCFVLHTKKNTDKLNLFSADLALKRLWADLGIASAPQYITNLKFRL